MGKILDTIVKYLPSPALTILSLGCFAIIMTAIAKSIDKSAVPISSEEQVKIYATWAVPALIISFIVMKITLLYSWQDKYFKMYLSLPD